MTDSSAQPGIIHAARRLLSTFMAIVHSRLELASIEWREEMVRVAGLLIMGAIAAAGVFMALITLTALVVILFWNQAAWVLGGFLVFYAFLAVAFSRLMIRGLEKPFFVDTITQLKKDRECLLPPN